LGNYLFDINLGLGIVTTLIVNRGTLKRGTVLVAGTSWAKVRTMTNEFNENVKEAGPSMPVRISGIPKHFYPFNSNLGWHYELPAPGELALEAPNEGRAQSVVDLRKQIKQETIFTKDMVNFGDEYLFKLIYFEGIG
jgi:translation initiation factor IF-2